MIKTYAIRLGEENHYTGNDLTHYINAESAIEAKDILQEALTAKYGMPFPRERLNVVDVIGEE